MILTNDWIVCKLHKAIAFLALICAGTFTGSLTDFSSSTSTLEIYMPSQTITKVHVYHCTRFLNVLYQLRNAQAFRVTYSIHLDSSICFLGERCTGF